MRYFWNLIIACLITVFSSAAFAGGPAHIIISSSNANQMENIMDGIGTGVGNTDSRSFVALETTQGSAAGSWGHWYRLEIQTVERNEGSFQTFQGHDLALGFERRISPLVLVGLALGEQRYNSNSGNYRSDSQAFAPYFSFDFGRGFGVDALYLKSDNSFGNNRPRGAREGFAVRLNAGAFPFGELLINPFAYYSQSEQGIFGSNTVSSMRKMAGIDATYSFKNFEAFARVARDIKYAAYGRVESLDEPHGGYSYRLGVSGSLGGGTISASFGRENYPDGVGNTASISFDVPF